VNMDGFHIADGNRVGSHVPRRYVECSEPLETVARGAWKYHADIPEDGYADRYFYTGNDIARLTQWSPEDIQTKVRRHKWRSRYDTTTKERAYYLFDLLATVWSYLTELPGERINRALLAEARSRYQRPNT
jgi:hypothetical protein